MTYNSNIIKKVQCNKYIISSKPDIYIREKLDILLKTVEYNNRLLVIMMNPSIADDKTSDRTINKIIDYFNNNKCSINNILGFKYISIVNLFSICCQNSKELNSFFIQISENGNDKLTKIVSDNRDVIRNKINESNYVVLGWGNSPDNFYETCFHTEVLNVISLLKELKKDDIYIFHIKNNRQPTKNILTNRKNPVHPSNGNINGLFKVEIDELNRIIINKK